MKVRPPRICIPITVERASEIATAMNHAARFADFIELRLDYLNANEIGDFLALLPTLAASAPCPLILTMRPVEQGGRSTLRLSQRLEFWLRILKTENCYFDLELEIIEELGTDANLDWRRIICSHHDFRGVPSDLEQIYQQMTATRAGILKIAVTAKDAIDCLPIFQLLDRAAHQRRPLIAIAMGQTGLVTRILGPSRGSFLTYASLDQESATAAGQATAQELRELYRIDRIRPATQIFGIIGDPISHSLSPQIHNAAFGAVGIDAVYIPFEVHNVNEVMRRLVQPRSREMNWNLRGLSVTAPHKLIVMNRLDWIDATAKEIRAVNTIVVRADQLYGYNTDATGFIDPLRRKYDSLKDARVAIIGAGGAARAALWGLNRESAKSDLFVRDPASAEFVAREFHVGCKTLMDATFKAFDIVVNATPLGTRGKFEKATPARAEELRNVRLVYDLVYNPEETRLLREARSAGCETLGGLEMLIAQAAEQFKLWTGTVPKVEVMRAAAVDALSRQSSIKSAASNI
jgi:3-dehydroquinate dehydratase / shikimate dehydrogenase